MKKLTNVLIGGVMGLASYSAAVQADLTTDAEQIFNAAEVSFANYFPSTQTTQQIATYLYRYYPSTNMYLGVNSADNGVYVLGGAFGNTPAFVGSITAIKSLLGVTAEQSGTLCNTSSMPQGMSYSQSGNQITISTYGQCIKLTASSLCQPKSSSATNVSVLSSVNNTSSKVSGIASMIPGIDLQSMIAQSANVNATVCTINAPTDYANVSIKYDVCYDVTDSVAATTTSSPYITVTPPVTVATAGTVNNQTVADCFSSNATVVTDVFNNKTWVKVNNQFVQQ